MTAQPDVCRTWSEFLKFSHVVANLSSLQQIVIYILHVFQEKKGAPAQDPQEREKLEIAKLDKLLSMVRDPPPEAKTN